MFVYSVIKNKKTSIEYKSDFLSGKHKSPSVGGVLNKGNKRKTTSIHRYQLFVQMCVQPSAKYPSTK